MSERMNLYAFSIMAALGQPNRWEVRTGALLAGTKESALGAVYLYAKEKYPDSRNVRAEVHKIPREVIKEVIASWKEEEIID